MKIKKNSMLLFIVFIFMFEPKLLVKYDIVNYIYIAGALISFLYMLSIYIVKRIQLSKMMIFLILFRLSFMFQTFLNNGDIEMWGYMSIITATMCMVIEYYSKKSPRELLQAIVNVLILILSLNCIISILYPDGLINEIYFIGIRTRFTDVVFVTIALTILLDKIDNKVISARSIISLALCLFHIFNFWIATAIIGIVVAAICYFIIHKKHIIIDLRMVALISIIITLLLLLTNIMDGFSWFIEKYLGKSVTMSGRTVLWTLSKDYIESSPIFGHGTPVNGNFILSYYKGNYILRQAHNQWLQIMYEGGIVSSAFFVGMIYLVNAPLKKNISCTGEFKVVYIAIIAFLIMMLSEIFSHTPYFYVLLFVGYNANNFLSQKASPRIDRWGIKNYG